MRLWSSSTYFLLFYQTGHFRLTSRQNITIGVILLYWFSKKNIGKFCRRPLHLIPSRPRSWSWLASTDQKVWADRPGLIGRFSLFINKHEVCNAYTELNERPHGVAAAILRVCQAFSGSVMIKRWQWTRRSALQLIEYGLWELGFWD